MCGGRGRGDCLVTHRDVSVLRCCLATKVQLLAAVQGGPLQRHLPLSVLSNSFLFSRWFIEQKNYQNTNTFPNSAVGIAIS